MNDQDFFEQEDQDREAKRINAAVNLILSKPQKLTDTQKRDLACILRPYLEETGADAEYGADFDVGEELNQQIAAVRKMRRMAMNPKDGNEVSVRELKEIVTSGTSLLKTLLSVHEKVVNFDRLKAIEDATVATVKEQLSKRQQEQFFETLEEELARIG